MRSRVDRQLTVAERWDNAHWITLALGGAVAAYPVWWFATEGLNLKLDIVNCFLGLRLLLTRSPIHYVELVADASTTVGQIIIQYPL